MIGWSIHGYSFALQPSFLCDKGFDGSDEFSSSKFENTVEFYKKKVLSFYIVL